jgi:dCTP deaminase
LVYDKLTDIPDQIYGHDIGSHYQAQGLKLSKHFKQG